MPKKKLTDKQVYDIGMKAGRYAGKKALEKAKQSGVTGDKKLADIRQKAEQKAHKKAVEKTLGSFIIRHNNH